MQLAGLDPKDAALFDAIATIEGCAKRLAVNGVNPQAVAADLLTNIKQYRAALPPDVASRLEP